MTTVLKYLGGDRVIWMVAVLLAVISVLAVYSSIATLAYKYHGGNTEYFLIKHLFMVISGFVIMYYTHRLKFKYYSRLSQIAIYVAAILLLLTLFIGVSINEANRWLVIPVIGQNFQTSDLGKLALIVFTARQLAQKQAVIQDLKAGVLPVIIPVFGICALILPANFSTAAILFATALVLMFIGRIRIIHLGLTVGAALAGFALLLLFSFAAPGVLPRLDTWQQRIVEFVGTDEKQEEGQDNYQVKHAKIAIASGGMMGKGPSNGNSRNFLPHPYSDMIYAFIIEEYGSMFGGLGILLLYLILLYRSIRIATKCRKSFGTFLATGLSLMLVFQAIVNMGVAVNLFPVTGQPLPMVSMGGTSLWFTCVSLGIILSVSREVQEEENENPEDDKA